MFFAHFQNPQTEIFKIINKSNNTTTFYMQGNGKFYVHNGQQKTLQLDESGLLRTREVIVDANEWADFVFKESYKLPTLKYVEEYIGINGHLPEVPSEMDVLENGINVADMYKTLLLKIEELTLYTIEQQKEIEILKKQINK